MPCTYMLAKEWAIVYVRVCSLQRCVQGAKLGAFIWRTEAVFSLQEGTRLCLCAWHCLVSHPIGL